MAWVWIGEESVLAVHDRQLSEHGGISGVRDKGLLLSALARARHVEAYGSAVDAAGLAAAYGYGIARNPPFLDGNKRTALVVTETFLNLSGASLAASNAACVVIMLAVADGSLSEEEFAAWIRENSAKCVAKKKSGKKSGAGKKTARRKAR